MNLDKKRFLVISIITTIAYYLIACFITFDLMCITQFFEWIQESGKNRALFVVFVINKLIVDSTIFLILKMIKS